MQRQELPEGRARRRRRTRRPADPGKYRWVPEELPAGSPYNVAQLYGSWREHPRRHTVSPGFDAAVTRHRLIDMIARLGHREEAGSAVISAASMHR